MIRLLQLISWRHVRHHRLRTLLTFLGMALGVAVIIAIALVNRALTTSFQSTIEQIAGKAVLQVSNSESGMAEAVLPLVRDTEGVLDVAAAVDGFLPVSGARAERLYIYGVDLLTDFTMRDHKFAGDGFAFDRALDFIAQPDSIAVTESFARRLGLSIGSTLALNTSRGKQNFMVRALLKETGTARVFGGNFALMDLPVAQLAFGKEGKLDIVDLTVEAGATVETVQEKLRQRLRGAADVERPKKRGEQIESLLTSFRVGLFFVSLIALFVGFFLIYNTVSVSVVQRKREIGTLRCLGMRRSELLRLIVAEALILAIVGAVAGCLLGWALAQAALLAVGETVRNLFSSIGLLGNSLSARELAIALASAVGVALFAALHPALEALHISPLENARQAVWRPVFVAKKSWSIRLGMVCFAVAPLLILLAPQLSGAVRQFSAGVIGMLIFLLGLAFFAPLMVRWVAQLLWRSALVLPGVSWVETRLAADSLRRNPLRSGITVATMIISLAAIFTIAAFVNSVRGSLLAWVDQMVTADIIISSGSRTAGPRNVSLHEEPAAGLRALPGVKIVDLYRLVRANYQGSPIVVSLFLPSNRRACAPCRWPKGMAAVRCAKWAKPGRHCQREFSDSICQAAGRQLRTGHTFRTGHFQSAGDQHRLFFRHRQCADQPGALQEILARRTGRRLRSVARAGRGHGGADRKNQSKLRREVSAFYQHPPRAQGRRAGIMEQSFVVNYAVEIVALVVAIFSVINTLLASILDRSREIGVLRAIGATQSQVRRIIVMEAGWMGLIGGLLGLFAGSVMAYHHVVYNTKLLTGWTFQFFTPTMSPAWWSSPRYFSAFSPVTGRPNKRRRRRWSRR